MGEKNNAQKIENQKLVQKVQLIKCLARRKKVEIYNNKILNIKKIYKIKYFYFV